MTERIGLAVGSTATTIEQLDMAQFGRVLHERPTEPTPSSGADERGEPGEFVCYDDNGKERNRPALDAGTVEAKLLESLSDRNVVHLNMLRGTIAKPSWQQIKHLYPEQFNTDAREALLSQAERIAKLRFGGVGFDVAMELDDISGEIRRLASERGGS